MGLARQAALFVVLACLVGCEDADPFYRNASLGGGSGGAGAVDGRGDMTPSDGMGGDPSSDATIKTDALPADGAGDRPADQGTGDAGVPAVDGSDGPPEVGCVTCKMDVLYWCEGTAANTIRATFELVNDTGAPVPLHQYTIRYWFTKGGGSSPWEFACDNGSLLAVPENIIVTEWVTNRFGSIAPTRPGADMYFEVGFSIEAGDLLPHQKNVFRTRVYRADYSTIIQTDDYSFNAMNVGPPSAWSHITLYRNGVLIAGTEPPR